MKFATRYIALSVVVLTLPALAQQRFTLEQVMSGPFPSDLTTSQQGHRIAWAVAQRGQRNVYVADAPNWSARQVTHYDKDDGYPIASVRLTPDGKTVLYARGSETNRENEVADPTSNVTRPRQQVFAVEVDGNAQPRLLGEMECGQEGCENIEISPDGQWAVWPARKQLWIAPVSGANPAKQLAYIRGDNRMPRWSPDSKQLAFVSLRDDHSFVGVYTLNGDTIRWIAPSVDRDTMPRWSPDGKQLAFFRSQGRMDKQPIIPIRPEPFAIYIGNPADGTARAIWHSGQEEVDSFPRLTADDSFYFANGRIIFAYEHDGWNHLYSIAPSGGEATLLTPGEFDVEHVALSSDRNSVIYDSNQADVDRRHIWRVPIAGGTPQQLTRGEGSEWNATQTGDGQFIVCLGSGSTTPATVYLVTPQSRQMIAKELMPADFPSAQLVTPQQVTFQAEDGWTIHGQLFLPKGRTAPGPALLFMHGGSKRQMLLDFHYMYYYHNAYAMNQYLASQGYAVLSVNYRTGIMYGRKFREPHDGGWRGASEYKDIVAAARYLQQQPYVDKAKIGLWGGSYGGYLTAMGLARNSDIFAAGVDMHGVHDWSVRQNRLGNEAGTPDAREAQRLAFESSPNSSIAKWRSPVLLIQGDDDRNVAFSQTVDLAQRLRAQKVPFEQLVFPDEIHDFLLWRSWNSAYHAGTNFFDRVLKRGETIAAGE